MSDVFAQVAQKRRAYHDARDAVKRAEAARDQAFEELQEADAALGRFIEREIAESDPPEALVRTLNTGGAA